MKKWFLNLESKKKIIIHVVMSLLWFVVILITPEEDNSFSDFCVLLWLAINVIEILFIVWHIKFIKKEKKNIENIDNTEKQVFITPNIENINNDIIDKDVNQNSKSSMCDRQLVFVDVETANAHNNTICSIGLIIVNKDNSIKEVYSLINPKSEFSDFNISIHHIKPSDVVSSPTFDEFWKNIKNEIDNDAIFVAHNAKFDLNVIIKDLNRYFVEFAYNDYFDTMELARKYLYNFNTEKGDLKLDTLCRKFSISLNHHNALEDVKACKSLFDIFGQKYNINLDGELLVLNEDNGFIGHYQSGSISYQGDFSKCIFLYKYGYEYAMPILKNEEYPNYIYRSLGIKDAVTFHKKMITEGYLIKATIEQQLYSMKVDELKIILTENNIVTKGKKVDLINRIIEQLPCETISKYITNELYVVSEKGKKFVDQNKAFVLIHKYEWGITWNDIVKFRKDKISDNDIIWKIFNDRLIKEPNYCRNTYHSMSIFLKEENKLTDSLLMLLRVLYIDISGYEYIKRYDNEYYFKSSIEEKYNDYDLERELAPGILSEINRLKDFYNEEMVEKVYRLNYPIQIFDNNMFKELLDNIFTSNKDIESIRLKAKEKWIDIINSRYK